MAINTNTYKKITEEVTNCKYATGGGINSVIDRELKIRSICKKNGCTAKEYRNYKRSFEKGGVLAKENKEMVVRNNHAIAHHSKELSEILKENKEIPAWVVAKVNRSATDLSDVAHYLDRPKTYYKGGQTQKEYTAEKVGKVMHEYKHGELHSGSGKKVTDRKQAIAIGLSVASKGWKHKKKKRKN